MKKLTAIVVALLATTATPALADPITYTFTGAFTGTQDGNQFTAVPAVFTGIGNTNNSSNNGFGVNGIFSVALSSLRAVAGGTTYNVTTPSFFYVYPSSLLGVTDGQTRLGLGFDQTGLNALGLTSAAFNGYNGVSNFSQTPGATYFPGPGQSARFSANGSAFEITGFEGGTFAAAVPEPASWALMIGGFGLAGFALRRRSSVRTTVRFA